MRRRHRALLAAILVILALLLCGLSWMYFRIAAPPTSAAEVDVEGMQFERALYAASTEATSYTRPARIGVAPNGDLIVSNTDPKNRGVFRMDQGGRVESLLTPAVPFMMPAGVAVWPDGEVWVADYAGAHIIVFDDTGAEVTRIPVVTASSINIVEDRAYVCTLGEVRVFDQAGNELQSFGLGRGAGEGQLDIPHGAVPAGDDVIVADSLNSRVVRLRPDGTFAWAEGSRPKDMNAAPEGAFNVPSDLVIGERGYVFVLDGFNSQISIVDPETGDILKQVGETGSNDGQFYYPDGLAYLGGDRYAVADKFNGRVQIVRIPLPGATGVRALDTVTAGLGSIARVLACGALLLLALLLVIGLLLLKNRRSHADGDGEDSQDDVMGTDDV